MTTTQPPRKILDLLLVEDNPGDIVLFRECFKRLKVPHRLHAALDGEEALLFLEHGEKFRDSPRPDLILMDLTLPCMDGLELLQKVKSNPQLRQIPVIVFTGSAAEMDVSRSYDLHANCYIPNASAQAVHVAKYVKVKGANSPFDPALQSYWEERAGRVLLGRYTSAIKRAVLVAQEYKCAACQLPLREDDPIHFHHVIPKNDGGPTRKDNLRAVHQRCHAPLARQQRQ